MRGTAVAALLALCACSGAFGERAHEDFHQAIDSDSAPHVRVSNVAGTVQIEPWNKPVVDVSARKYGYDASELRTIAIDVRRDANVVSISTEYAGGNHSGGVRYRVMVPQAASAFVENVAGSVRLGPIAGDLDVETQAGTIDAQLGLIEGSRSIDLRATTGTISLGLARDSSARVDASSTVGAFSSDISGISSSSENIVGSSASGTIGSGAARIVLRTTTGAIRIRAIP